ncbi:MAG TPA: hypothetical protein VLA34_15320, partial [Candidatus Krumholzibacterium sp.]|nr:hypothetical protein [Candidatus Krumholzibacterium sp.]
SCVINDRFFTAEDCVFINNHADSYGGAVSVWNGSSRVDITDCVMEGNTAGLGGGAVIAYNCHVYLDGCTFYDNRADEKGSVAHVHNDATMDFWECTVSENGRNDFIFSSIGTTVLNLERTVVSFNTSVLFDLSPSTTGLVGCCNIFGNGGGDALPAGLGDAGRNLSEDPLFCGVRGSHNYYLTSVSPCWPSNRPDGLWCAVIGAWSVGCGSTAVESRSWGGIKALHRD